MLTLVRILARWPLWLLHALGAVLGWVGYAASPGYRQRLRENSALAGLNASQRRAAVAQAGKLVSELPRLWLRDRDAPMADAVAWEGAELMQAWLERGREQGRGLVLLTPHMGSFEVAAQGYAQRFGPQQPMTVLYRPARQRWLRELEESARARTHLATAPAALAGVRQMLRALKQGHTVGLLPDQVPPQGLGVWAPFYGREAYTMTLAARLVQQTGAQVGILWCERLDAGRGYVLHVRELAEPLPESAPDGTGAPDLKRGAEVMNRNMQAVIAECPTQYLWGYHRYKAPRQA